MSTPSLITRLLDEADQCRQDGANDIAKLLDEAASELQSADSEGTMVLDLDEAQSPEEIGSLIFCGLAMPAMYRARHGMSPEHTARLLGGAVSAIYGALESEFGKAEACELAQLMARAYVKSPALAQEGMH